MQLMWVILKEKLQSWVTLIYKVQNIFSRLSFKQKESKHLTHSNSPYSQDVMSVGKFQGAFKV